MLVHSACPPSLFSRLLVYPTDERRCILVARDRRAGFRLASIYSARSVFLREQRKNHEALPTLFRCGLCCAVYHTNLRV